MTNTFVAGWLSPAELAQAFPLMRFVYPEWTLASWIKRARRLGRKKPDQGGLMAIRDRRGMIHGLFSYEIGDDLANNKCLRISNLIFVRLPGGKIDDAILDGVERLSRECACQSLVIDVPLSQSKQSMLDRRSLDQHHFEMRGMVFRRAPDSSGDQQP